MIWNRLERSETRGGFLHSGLILFYEFVVKTGFRRLAYPARWTGAMKYLPKASSIQYVASNSHLQRCLAATLPGFPANRTRRSRGAFRGARESHAPGVRAFCAISWVKS